LFLWSVLMLLIVALAPALAADSKTDTLRPLENSAPAPSASETELRKHLEAEYRAELETRVAKETASMQGSLKSLWMSNAAVWTILFAFVVMQALAARKRGAELERLRNAREGKGG